ncbi:hypothetical protein GMSM_17000 [Geomonas sp. Red276]
MSKKSEQALLAFLAGAAVAAGAALLFTPKTGREVREKLGEAKDEALDKLKQKIKGRGRKGEQMNYDGGDCWI